MTSSKTQQPRARRLPYGKPVLRSISLQVDQVLGTACKAVDQNPGNYNGNACVLQLCKLEVGS